ncbi:ABC transporter permease, partial [Oceanivirga salmonicida]
MLGIIMGIASVVLLSSLGAGFQKKLLSEAQLATSKIIVVDFDQKYRTSNDIKESDYFSPKDELIFEKIDGVDKAILWDQDAALIGNFGEEAGKYII